MFEVKHLRYEQEMDKINEFNQSIKDISNEMVQKMTNTDKEKKRVKQDMKKQKKILKSLAKKTTELKNSRPKVSEFGSNESNLHDISEKSLKLSKEVNCLMTQNLDLKNLENKVKEDIKHINRRKEQVHEEITSENNKVSNLKRKLSSYSNSYLQNKKLSESVDLDQSKLESCLNIGKETKQELL